MDRCPPPTASPGPDGDTPFLKVLASGSGGNSSILLLPRAGTERPTFWLIDAGLSPRRTRRLLGAAGLSLDGLAGILLTHLDSDHWYTSWSARLPPRARLVAHEAHAGPGLATGLLPDSVEPIRGGFDLAPGVIVHTRIVAHDELGAASFRFEFPGASLGFATDVGRVDPDLIGHLRGVNVLAIESNYCPAMQQRSGRPWFLKQRIMGGRGHLSNQQSAAAVRAIGPTRHVVLLHLSRECNEPSLVRDMHVHSGWELTVTSQHQPTPWIPIVASVPRGPRPVPVVDAPLFEAHARSLVGKL